ncbi:Protein phosphatase 2A-associated protein [Phaffia rhodozyma]|uniref:Protein phosphatase 2A-associated protein n=1 Tax=Phaffia rhodozyma TaxID=264483 RepID=A0A0F7SIJ9_PHARH|nr:Protein phosphatase 2A-associated protein [Phaffia rhodozyma]
MSFAEDLEELSLAELFSKALILAGGVYDEPTNAESTQTALETSYRATQLAKNLLDARGVFSTNEQVEDVSTHGLAFMFVGYVAGEVGGRLRTEGRDERVRRLKQAKIDFQGFINLLDAYSIVPPSEREKLRRTGTRDPTIRREEKINQFRWEKQVRSSLETLSNRTTSDTSSNDFMLINSLLPPPPSTPSSSSSSAYSHLEASRTYTLALLSLLYAQTLNSLESIEQEEELLSNAPAEISPVRPGEGERADDRSRMRDGDDNETAAWRLDRVDRGGPDGRGELMDKSGKPLRPFTVLPSATSTDERTRLQSEVFRASHRLPTMSIDEYLKNEFDTGRVITGGGKASEEAPTTNEILQLASEQDGLLSAIEADEKKRLKDENWAVYTEENAKGAGNTMNR